MSDSSFGLCRGVRKVQNLFWFSHLVTSSRNCKIPTLSKCETRNSYQWLFKMWHVFLAVWSVWFCYYIILISLVLLIYNTPHWSSNSWSHDTLLWWSCISNAVFGMHSNRYLSQTSSLHIQFWHLTWLHLCCTIFTTLSWSLQSHKPIPPLLIKYQVLFIPYIPVPTH